MFGERYITAGSEIYTTSEVATICRVSPPLVRKWCNTGLLKFFRIPGGLDRRISQQDLEQFIRDHNLTEFAGEC